MQMYSEAHATYGGRAGGRAVGGFKGSPAHFYLCGNVLIGRESEEKQPSRGKCGENASSFRLQVQRVDTPQFNLRGRRSVTQRVAVFKSDKCSSLKAHCDISKASIGLSWKRKSENHLRINQVCRKFALTNHKSVPLTF